MEIENVTCSFSYKFATKKYTLFSVKLMHPRELANSATKMKFMFYVRFFFSLLLLLSLNRLINFSLFISNAPCAQLISKALFRRVHNFSVKWFHMFLWSKLSEWVSVSVYLMSLFMIERCALHSFNTGKHLPNAHKTILKFSYWATATKRFRSHSKTIF